MKKHVIETVGFILVLALISCAAKQRNILESTESQAKLRSMQSRVYDITDRNRLLRTIIATLQDLGFVIDDADETLGTVSGTKRAGYSLIMTVSVRPKGTRQMIVRSNAQYNLQTVEDPEPYQQFFSALSKALFLEVNIDSVAGKAYSTASYARSNSKKDRSKSVSTDRNSANEYAKKNTFIYKETEPWTGVWNVEGHRYFVGKWALKQNDKKVVSTKTSSHKIDSLAVGDQLNGKIKTSSKVFPFAIKISSDGQSFKGTSTDYYGRSVHIRGKRRE